MSPLLTLISFWEKEKFFAVKVKVLTAAPGVAGVVGVGVVGTTEGVVVVGLGTVPGCSGVGLVSVAAGVWAA